MTSPIDWFVATIAFIGAGLALIAGVGTWSSPYRLRTIALIADRFGMSAARCVWIVVAIISLIAGAVIATGTRPGFARPDHDQVDRAD